MKPFTVLQVFAAIAGLILSACSPAPVPLTSSPTPPLVPELTPYQARSATPSPAPVDKSTPTPLPSTTPTPLIHVVSKGQDMFGIALYYGIGLDALKTANPEINPNFLPVGANLVVPGVVLPTATVANPTPTPLPVETARPNCLPELNQGLWCFLAVHNPGPGRLESFSARLSLSGSGGEILEATAYSPLNLLEPGAEIALAAYFPAPIPAGYQVSAEILTALPVLEGDTRYLAAQLEQPAVIIDPSGLSATFSAQAVVKSETSASTIWVAVIAYDARGQIVGMRRWENEQPSPAGERLPITVQIYSVGPTIARVEALVEARP
jgi:hypothetical protein